LTKIRQENGWTKVIFTDGRVVNVDATFETIRDLVEREQPGVYVRGKDADGAPVLIHRVVSN